MRARRLLAIGVVAVLVGCQGEPAHRDWTVMDCNFAASLHGRGKVSPEAALDTLAALSHAYDRLFSDYDPQGPLSVLRGRKGDTVRVDSAIATVIRKGLATQVRSRDAFDMGMHDLKQMWGIGTDHGHVPPKDSIELFLRRRFGFLPKAGDSIPLPFSFVPDGRVVLATDSLPIDLGGIAKGYAVDRLSDKLVELGYPDHLLQGGGEIRARGRKSNGQWKIGVKNPRQTDSILAVVSLDTGMAVSTSGDYERFFLKDGVRYHHIFAPATGAPYRGATISATLLCSTSLDCDALSKPMFLMGPRRGRLLADSLGISVLWVRESPSGLCGRTTDAWGKRLQELSIPNCPADW
jgi:FAD:protein FMN transferase